MPNNGETRACATHTQRHKKIADKEESTACTQLSSQTQLHWGQVLKERSRTLKICSNNDKKTANDTSRNYNDPTHEKKNTMEKIVDEKKNAERAIKSKWNFLHPHMVMPHNIRIQSIFLITFHSECVRTWNWTIGCLNRSHQFKGFRHAWWMKWTFALKHPANASDDSGQMQLLQLSNIAHDNEIGTWQPSMQLHQK